MHVQPEPFGGGYGPCPRRRVRVGEDAMRLSVDRVAFALDNPPLETAPPAGEEHTFTITGSKTPRRFHVDGGVLTLPLAISTETRTSYVWESMPSARLSLPLSSWLHSTTSPTSILSATYQPTSISQLRRTARYQCGRH